MQTELGGPLPEEQGNSHEADLAAARSILRGRRDASQQDILWAERLLRRADPNSRERVVWSA